MQPNGLSVEVLASKTMEYIWTMGVKSSTDFSNNVFDCLPGGRRLWQVA